MATNPYQGLPLIRIENTGAAQTNVPFTFGQVFKLGALKPGAGLAAQIEGGTIPLQVDYKANHGDGSVRHAVVSGILPKLAAGATLALQLVEAKASASKALSPAVMPDGAVEITIDGVKYSTNGSKFGDVIEWLSGPIVVEGIVTAELLGPDGKPHPQLTIRAGIRVYSTGKVRAEVTVENTKTWIPARSYKYDVVVKLGGKTVFEQKALTHYRQARWRKLVWLGDEPAIHVRHDIEYVIATKAVSNYNTKTNITSAYLDEVAKSSSPENTAPMKLGPITNYMPMAGGRGDIGSLTSAATQYLVTADKRARAPMMAAAEGSGSWSIHYRDEKTGYPIRTDNEANKNLTTHPNMSNQGPLPVPRYVSSELAHTPYEADTAHQPSLAYLPYLLTGEYYYLEELQFWASWNPLGTAPDNHGNGKGLVRWQQLRGQAWSMRTLGHAAYITPDKHPLKGYFNKQLQNNLDFYHSVYVVGSPNKLGLYDGSGENSAPVEISPCWQDDFMTWSFGYLAELGFEKAAALAKWKAKYPVGRMTGPGYCWIQGAAYKLKFRDTPTSPVYDTFEKLYRVNYEGPNHYDDNGTLFVHPQGLQYIDQPCGSQAQIDFLSLVHHFKFEARRMTGYSDSDIGYPANMQPALAVAADSGIENAGKAWALFQSRSAKPSYKSAPQWDILPRVNVTETVEITPPATTPPVVTAPVSSDGTWEKIGAEGQKLIVPTGSRVRYGFGTSYLEKDVSGEFTATNEFFGNDPAVGKVKTVEIKKKLSYSVKAKTVYMLLGPDGSEVGQFDDEKLAQQVLSKILD